MEDNNYYPFGLKHTGYGYKKMIEYYIDDTIQPTDPPVTPFPEEPITITSMGMQEEPSNGRKTYNYKYNGKELQTDLDINLYDYGARNYDPAIGRWFNMDPLQRNITISPRMRM